MAKGKALTKRELAAQERRRQLLKVLAGRPDDNYWLRRSPQDRLDALLEVQALKWELEGRDPAELRMDRSKERLLWRQADGTLSAKRPAHRSGPSVKLRTPPNAKLKKTRKR